MSDARLRELERTFAATGSVADEAALLRERLRVGAITSKGVEIVANYLSYPAALEVLGGVNETWEYLCPDPFPDEIASISVEQKGIVVPLGALVAIPFALEMASILHEARSDVLPEQEVRPYIRLARSLSGKRKQLSPAQVQLGLACDNIVHNDGGTWSVREPQLMCAIIVYAAEAFHSPCSSLQRILVLFLRDSNIVGHMYPTRRLWARRAILHVVVPHLLGHPSMVPFYEHLWEAKRKVPPTEYKRTRRSDG